jgi:hypothetical protein
MFGRELATAHFAGGTARRICPIGMDNWRLLILVTMFTNSGFA